MLKDKIYQKIRDDIFFGVLMPGERLTEIQVSKRFGCSRGPIREAFNLLDREGFITLVPNQGALVKKISLQEITDYYMLLELLEGKTIELATAILSKRHLKELEQLNNSMKSMNRDDKNYVERWNTYNLSYHKLIHKNCGNEKMEQVIDEVLLRITRYRFIFLTSRDFNEYQKDHDILICYLRKKDAKNAKKYMERHVTRAKECLLNLSHQPAKYAIF